jgi:hypothetical protein
MQITSETCRAKNFARKKNIVHPVGLNKTYVLPVLYILRILTSEWAWSLAGFAIVKHPNN